MRINSGCAGHDWILQLRLRKAELCVHVGIMRLKPVAKRAPQHALRGARRAALHHKMFAVKKIGRVTRVKRKRFEAGKRRENRRRPLPSVAEQIAYAKSALARGMRVDRRWIPIRKIEIPALAARLDVSPRIRAFAFRWRAVRGAMPLRFG